MRRSTSNRLVRTILLGSVLGATGAAQAGPVSLGFDPLVGSFLPGMAYRGTMNFFVTDACAGNAPGTVLVNTVTQCGGTLAAATTLTLFEVANPPNFATAAFTVQVQSLWVNNGFVEGWTTDTSPFLATFSGPPLNTGYPFSFQFVDYLPRLLAMGASDLLLANTDGYVGVVHHTRDDGSSRKGQECSGRNIGVRITARQGDPLDFQPTGVPGCSVAPHPIPEPGTLALALAALAAGAALRPRRSNPV